MTWSLVQSNTAATTNTSPAAPAYGSGTTANNLLIAVFNLAGGTTQPSPPAGWTLVASATVSSPNTGSVWIFANFANAGGITTVSTTFTATTCHSQVYEFTCPGVAQVSARDQNGSATAATIAATLAIATSGNLTANHELAFSGYLARYSAATAATLTAGSGFTQGGVVNNGTSIAAHSTFDYELDTGSSAGATVTDTVANNSAGAGSNSGAIVTFAQPSATSYQAPAQPGQTWQRVFQHRMTPDQGSLGPPAPTTGPPPPVLPGPAWLNYFRPAGYPLRPMIMVPGPAVSVVIPSGSQPSGFVTRHAHTRAVTGSNSQLGGGFTGTAHPEGQQPGGVAVHRTHARAVIGRSFQLGGGFAGIAYPEGQKPGGITPTRLHPRAELGPSLRNAGGVIAPLKPEGSTPGGTVIRRQHPRAVAGSTSQLAGGIRGTAFPNGQQTAGFVSKRPHTRAALGSTSQLGGGYTRIAYPEGSQPGGVAVHRTHARAVIGNSVRPGFTGQAFPEGHQPGGVVIRRPHPRAVFSSTVGRAFPEGAQPGGVAIRRQHPRAVVAFVPLTTTNAAPTTPGAGSQPGGIIAHRLHARAWIGKLGQGSGFTGTAFPEGAQPGGVAVHRSHSRAVTGRSYQLGAGFTGRAFPEGARPGGVVSYRQHPRAEVGSSLRNAGGEAGRIFPDGNRPGGVVYRHLPFRAVTAHVTGTANPEGSQAGGVVKRRYPARAFIAFVPVTTTNAAPTTPGAGSKPGGVAVYRQHPRAIWAKKIASLPPPPGSQPGGTVVHRTYRRAGQWAKVSGQAFPNGAQPHGLVAYRQHPRGSSRSVTAPFIGTFVPAPKRVPMQPRRYPGRAFIAFIPVAGTNSQFLPSQPVLPALVSITPAGANAASVGIAATVPPGVVIAPIVGTITVGEVLVTVTIAPAGANAVSVVLQQNADVPQTLTLRPPATTSTQTPAPHLGVYTSTYQSTYTSNYAPNVNSSTYQTTYTTVY